MKIGMVRSGVTKMVKLEKFNCDWCGKDTATGQFIRPKDNDEHDYSGTIFVCQKCHKKLT